MRTELHLPMTDDGEPAPDFVVRVRGSWENPVLEIRGADHIFCFEQDEARAIADLLSQNYLDRRKADRRKD